VLSDCVSHALAKSALKLVLVEHEHMGCGFLDQDWQKELEGVERELF
jgi:hypothetical protein